jgi:hypothetical protein
MFCNEKTNIEIRADTSPIVLNSNSVTVAINMPNIMGTNDK